jgi:hypothetical protein
MKSRVNTVVVCTVVAVASICLGFANVRFALASRNNRSSFESSIAILHGPSALDQRLLANIADAQAMETQTALIQFGMAGAFLCVAFFNWKRWKRERREAVQKAGLCTSCGYDLRACVGRCSECGMLIRSAVQTTTEIS